MFHKTVYNAWNLFKSLEQMSENFIEIQFSWVSINREELSIDWKIFLLMEQESNTNQNNLRLQDNFPHHFDQLSNSFDQSNILNFKFLLRKFQNLNFHFIHLTKEYSPTLYHYYNLSIYIPIYTTMSPYNLYTHKKTSPFHFKFFSLKWTIT